MSSSDEESSDGAVFKPKWSQQNKKKEEEKDIGSHSQHVHRKLDVKNRKMKHSYSERVSDQSKAETTTKKSKKKRKTQFNSHGDHLFEKVSISKKRKIEIDSESESSASDEEQDVESDVNLTYSTQKKQKDKKTEKHKKTDKSVPHQLNIDADNDEYTAIREELSHMSFEELHMLRDRLGVKVYNQVMQRGRKNDGVSSGQAFSRENKNRPMEISSKKRVSAFREIVHVKKKVTRDPRFDDLSGTFNESIFKSSYAFLDDVKKREREKLSKQLRRAKVPEQKQNLQLRINKMNQQESAEKQRKMRKDLEKKWKKKELGRVEEGKNPFFLKKGDLLKLELAEKYKELKKSGKLEKYLGKKRKKNASKERKKLPV